MIPTFTADPAALQNALMIAASNGHPTAVVELISAGASVNAHDSALMTPLHWACEKNKPGVVRRLLEMGANPNDTECGVPPLHYAVQNAEESYQNALMLIRAGADVNWKQGEDGMTALHILCRSNEYYSIGDIVC